MMPTIKRQNRKSLTGLVIATSFGAAVITAASSQTALAQQASQGQLVPVEAQASLSSVSQPTSTTAAPVQDPKEKIVCRQRVEIGTRLGKRRECLTVRQWEEIRVRSAEEAKRMQRNMGDKRG